MPSMVLGTTFTGPNSELFKVTDFLGHGAFGEVYRAARETSGAIVAVKLLPVGALSSPESRIALLNEIHAAQQIKHPNVVQVLHVNDGTSSQIGPHVVMEYVSGGNLANVLRAGTQIPIKRALEMMIKAHLFKSCPDVRTLRPEVPLPISQLLSRMVSKRPEDRPPWDEVLKVLSQPESENPSRNPTVTAAVEAAVARNQALQRQALEAKAKQGERELQLELYGYSCDQLLKDLSPVIDQFNDEFQHGKIRVDQNAGTLFYSIPQGQNIQLTFFAPSRTGILIRNEEVIGGGWLGLAHGRSANLVLLKHGPNDLYGRWSVCEVQISALVDTDKLIGKFGVTSQTVIPFGFKDAYFYDQIRYAAGGMHVFVYSFSNDVVGFFARLIHDACV